MKNKIYKSKSFEITRNYKEIDDLCKKYGINENISESQRTNCASTTKVSLCQHGRLKNQCKNCGTGYCQHGRLKNQCRECGTGYCQHMKKKGQCRECGTGYCEHGKFKFCCKECGTGYCEHRKQKGHCKECGKKCKIYSESGECFEIFELQSYK